MMYILSVSPNSNTKAREYYDLLEQKYGNDPFDYREAHQSLKSEFRIDDYEAGKIMFQMLQKGNIEEA